MTRQDQLFKWFIYSMGLVPVWALDAFLLGRYPLLGVKPLLLLLCVVVVASLEGALCGAGFGMGVGLLWVLGYESVNPGMIFFLTFAGAVVGSLTQYALTQGLLGSLLCAAAVLTALEGLHLAIGLFIRQASFQVLLTTCLRELVWTLVWTPLIYVLFLKIFRKVGLDRLA